MFGCFSFMAIHLALAFMSFRAWATSLTMAKARLFGAVTSGGTITANS
jgi:hypothetical protein